MHARKTNTFTANLICDQIAELAVEEDLSNLTQNELERVTATEKNVNIRQKLEASFLLDPADYG